ncbi:MAG: ABC transporter substrate-binding protein, partial [Sphaerobacter sp.]|nr:ABC transporter substrate-binding protein [Sphaerobacter sp.]
MAESARPNVTHHPGALGQTDLSRRALLRLLAASATGASLAALLAACGGESATPTPGQQSGQHGAAQPTATAPSGSPAAAATPAPAGGGTITVAITAPLQSLDPANHRDRVTETVLRAMFDGLVTRRQDGE